MTILLHDLSARAKAVVINNLTIYFSYSTPIAFELRDDTSNAIEFKISQNKWTRTTGKHLNDINPDKSIRIPHHELMSRLDQIIKFLPFETPNCEECTGIEHQVL